MCTKNNQSTHQSDAESTIFHMGSLFIIERYATYKLLAFMIVLVNLSHMPLKQVESFHFFFNWVNQHIYVHLYLIK